MKIENTKVIVTGGAGFMGSHLVDALLARNNTVTVIDDFSVGTRENLALHEKNSLLRIKKADICQEQALPALFAGQDFVFHLACRNVRLSLCQPTQVYAVNSTGTLNVLKASAGAGVRRLLYCSSSEVHGTAARAPLSENSSFFPETIYGASKLAGEHYTRVFQRSGWLDTVVARPHNNYGPRSHWAGVSGEAIPRFIVRALAGLAPVIYGDGSQTRDFTYVEETADFLVRLMESDKASGNTINVCHGEEVSLLEIAGLVRELSGLCLEPVFRPARPGDVLRLWGDPSRLKEILGEAPSVSIGTGLKKTFEWFETQARPSLETLKAMDNKGNWEQETPEPWLKPFVG